MSPEINAEQAKGQLDRLQYIEYRLRFIGSLGRGDLQKRFEIKGAAATRDIRLYKELYPDNLRYSNKQRQYLASDTFLSHIPINHRDVMTHLAADNMIASVEDANLIPINELSQQHLPKLDVFALLTKGIHTKTLQSLEYISLSSGLTTREIAPLALINTGVRWHLRAFDRKQNRYADFVVNRIKSVSPLDTPITREQSLVNDHQWNRIVTMKLVPHPKLAHPEAIELEYNMDNGVRSIEIRAALAGYFLRFWQVDSSRDHSLNAPDSYLWLSNRETLYDVENLAIAPGYNGTL